MADPRPLLDSYSLYIDGRWVDPGSGRYDDINPATEATIAQAPDAGLGDVDAAIAAARRAFDSGHGPSRHLRSDRDASPSWAMRSCSTPKSSPRCPRLSGAAPRTSV